MVRFLRLVLLTSGLSLLLLGCSSGANVVIESAIPQPLIDSVPMSVGIHYPEELKTFVFEEKIANHGTFTIELGTSQEHLFGRIFEALFADVPVIEELDQQPDGISAVIIPKVNQVQIAIPQQTRGDFYEVWISYSIRLQNLDGTLIHDWSFAAYGKANRKNYSNALDRSNIALTTATENALRDAAARISFYYVQESAVQKWIAGARTS